MKTKITIVAFVGGKGQGKTTARRILTEGAEFLPISFADILKQMLISLGIEPEYVYGDNKEIAHPILGDKTVRYAMQTLGTEWGRDTIYKDIWVKAWERRALQVLEEGGKVVTDDMRFQNEYDVVKSLGGLVVRITGRHNDESDPHPSEAFYKTVIPDFEIVNDGDQDHLRSHLFQVLSLAEDPVPFQSGLA